MPLYSRRALLSTSAAGGLLMAAGNASAATYDKALDDASLQAAPKLVVPSDAVVERNGQRVVFTVEQERAHALPVSVKGAFGAPGSGELELSDGPATGTRVIRHPDENIREGVSVKEKKT